MDVLAGDGHLGEQVVVVGEEVGVLVVERDDALVRKEDLPVQTCSGSVFCVAVASRASPAAEKTHHLSHLTSVLLIKS